MCKGNPRKTTGIQSTVSGSQSGKLRLVLILWHLNQFLRKDYFKYEDHRIALMFEKQNYLMKFDLKLGYRTV